MTSRADNLLEGAHWKWWHSVTSIRKADKLDPAKERDGEGGICEQGSTLRACRSLLPLESWGISSSQPWCMTTCTEYCWAGELTWAPRPEILLVSLPRCHWLNHCPHGWTPCPAAPLLVHWTEAVLYQQPTLSYLVDIYSQVWPQGPTMNEKPPTTQEIPNV